jgi:CDK inhibitor PHO81
MSRIVRQDDPVAAGAGLGRVLPELQGASTRCVHVASSSLRDQALKKIINSYAAGRPASDASLLSLGLRPGKRPHSEFQPALASPSSSDVSRRVRVADLDPLPPETEPPAPSRSGSYSQGRGSDERGESFRAHRDVFFFTLQRELEKVCLPHGSL